MPVINWQIKKCLRLSLAFLLTMLELTELAAPSLHMSVWFNRGLAIFSQAVPRLRYEWHASIAKGT